MKAGSGAGSVARGAEEAGNFETIGLSIEVAKSDQGSGSRTEILGRALRVGAKKTRENGFNVTQLGIFHASHCASPRPQGENLLFFLFPSTL